MKEGAKESGTTGYDLRIRESRTPESLIARLYYQIWRQVQRLPLSQRLRIETPLPVQPRPRLPPSRLQASFSVSRAVCCYISSASPEYSLLWDSLVVRVHGPFHRRFVLLRCPMVKLKGSLGPLLRRRILSWLQASRSQTPCILLPIAFPFMGWRD